MGFFDELGKKAAETMQGAKDKTAKFSNEMKLKSKLSERKDKITLLNVDIGKEVYSNYTKDMPFDTENIKNKCKEIMEINKELLALKDVKICTSCGGQVPVNSEFCPKCGEKQIKVTVNVNDGAKETEVVKVENVEELKVEENSKFQEEDD